MTRFSFIFTSAFTQCEDECVKRFLEINKDEAHNLFLSRSLI